MSSSMTRFSTQNSMTPNAPSENEVYIAPDDLTCPSLASTAEPRALERHEGSGGGLLLVFAPRRPGRLPQRGEVCIQTRASDAEHLRRSVARRLIWKRCKLQIAGARTRDEHVAK